MFEVIEFFRQLIGGQSVKKLLKTCFDFRSKIKVDSSTMDFEIAKDVSIEQAIHRAIELASDRASVQASARLIERARETAIE